MPNGTSSIKTQDPATSELFDILTKQRGTSVDKIDQGVGAVNFSDPANPQFEWRGAKDGKYDVSEVIRAALDQVKPEIFEDDYLRGIVEKLGDLPPWVITDLNPNTTGDQELFLQMQEAVDEAKLMVVSKEALSERGYKQELMKQIVKATYERWPSIYNAKSATEADIGKMLANPGKNCLEVALIFYVLFSLAELKPEFVEMEIDETGAATNHMFLAVPLVEEDSHIFFDFGNQSYIGRAYADKIWHPMGLNDVFAEYKINRYYAQKFASPADKEALLLDAYRFAPERFRSSYHLALFYEERGRLDEALKYYKTAYEVSGHSDLPIKIEELSTKIPN